MEKILYQLDLLEEYFYDNIDYSLLQHPDLCNFAIQLEKIKHTITYELTHPNANTHANANTNIDEDTEITPTEFRLNNYLQQYGVAYGWDDLHWANDTIHLTTDYIKELEIIDDKTVDNFINYWKKKIF